MLRQRRFSRQTFGEKSICPKKDHPLPLMLNMSPGSWTGFILCGEGFKDLVPIAHRSQTLESLLHAFMVVPVDIIIDCFVELLQAAKRFTVAHLNL
ncbi:hypothetical protein FRC0190_00701 [Corynebacterium rouxii]|uniref:Uncharacterized protein n=1 Tax=Corynebacterium rouxii TaxID=2719119 RepID=A0A6I8MEQ5_9CORY|nr:hypothetical protein FRC0190_00701 [Corynebacterium rouxii]